MIIEQLELLCMRDNKKISNVLKEIGASPSSTDNWRKNNEIKSSTLIKLADYFNVSTDYILGREEQKTGITDNSINRTGDNMNGGNKTINQSNELEPLEQELINQFRKMNKLEQLKELTRLEEKSKGDEKIEN